VHFAPVGHGFPHLPQFWGSLLGSTQEFPQLMKPAAQKHTPVLHVWFALHALPHAPQLFASV
jgi:hypothetical protein